MATPKTCDNCSVTWDKKYNVKDIVLCPLHAAAPDMLVALEGLLALGDMHTNDEWTANFDSAEATIAHAKEGS